MKAPSGADLMKRACVLLSGGVPAEGEGGSGVSPPVRSAGLCLLARGLGLECGGTDRSEPAVAACRPGTSLCTHTAHGALPASLGLT